MPPPEKVNQILNVVAVEPGRALGWHGDLLSGGKGPGAVAGVLVTEAVPSPSCPS